MILPRCLPVRSSLWIAGFPEPNYTSNADWKRRFILPGRTGASRGNSGKEDPTVPAKSETIAAAIKHMLSQSGVDGAKIELAKSASLARRSSSQQSINAGLGDVQAAGRWGNRSVTEQSYLTNPSPGVTRALAGQPPRGGAFNISRLVLFPTRDELSLLMPCLVAALEAQEALPPAQQVRHALALRSLHISRLSNQLSCLRVPLLITTEQKSRQIGTCDADLRAALRRVCVRKR